MRNWHNKLVDPDHEVCRDSARELKIRIGKTKLSIVISDMQINGLRKGLVHRVRRYDAAVTKDEEGR